MQPPRLTIKSLWRLYNEAQQLLEAGRTEDAAQHFSRVADAKVRKPRGADPGSWDECNPLVERARLGLCYCYVEQGRLETAMTLLRQVLDVEPTSVDALCELAHVLALQGRRQEAREVLERAVRHHPTSAPVHKALGYFFLQDEDLDRAIAECRLAVELDPDYDAAWVELAVALDRAGHDQDAVDAMVQALSLAPDNTEYYYSLAAFLRDLHRDEDALRIAERGLSLAPYHADLLELAAELWLEQGYPEQAIEAAQRLLREVPSSLVARDILGVAYLQQGRVNDSLRMADQLVALNPLDPSAHFRKAVLFQQQGMLREALAEFSRVVSLAPETQMAEESVQAIDAIDGQQIRLVMLLASEDPLFRARLRRDPQQATNERGFCFSEAGISALSMLDVDFFLEATPNRVPVMYN